MTTAEFDLSALARTGGEVAVFEALLASIPAESTPKSKSTVATRKEASRRALEEWNLDRLLELQAKMSRIIDVMTANDLNTDDEPVMSPAKTVAVMAEYLDERDVAELLDVRKDMIRDAVYTHIDAVEGPDANGAIEVPELGKKFTREGCGTATPTVDEQRLQALLGEKWLDACDETIVPAQEARIEYKLSVEKVLDLAHKDPAVLEALRSCLVPGKPKTPRFWVRDL